MVEGIISSLADSRCSYFPYCPLQRTTQGPIPDNRVTSKSFKTLNKIAAGKSVLNTKERGGFMKANNMQYIAVFMQWFAGRSASQMGSFIFKIKIDKIVQ